MFDDTTYIIYIIYIVTAILVPLIPASILYKKLGNQETDVKDTQKTDVKDIQKTNVQGRFMGLEIKLQGAIAGYFLCVVIVFGFINSLPKIQPKPYKPNRIDVYIVKGRINIGNQKELEDTRMSLIPSERNMKPNGAFQIEIPVKPDQQGKPAFPSIIIEHPQYQTETVEIIDDPSIPIEREHIDHNKDAQIINIKEPILLKRKDADPPFSPKELLAIETPQGN